MLTKIGCQVLGETADTLTFQDLWEVQAVSTHMVRQARRRVLLFSRDLDAPVFDQAPFLEAVKTFAVSSRHARVQVLVQDSGKIVKHGHRLVELARRLSSSIALRKPHPDYLEHPETFLLVDASGLVHRKLSGLYEGTASFHDPLKNRRLAEFFKQAWESSEPDPELRRLYL